MLSGARLCSNVKFYCNSFDASLRELVMMRG